MTMPSVDAAAAPRRRASATREVLIASHGGASGAAAVRIGRLVADRWHAPAEVVGVLTPVAMYPPEVAVDLGLMEEAERSALLAQLTAQVTALSRSAADTPICVVTGPPTDLIVEVAQEHHAALVVLGLGRRELLDRLFGGPDPRARPATRCATGAGGRARCRCTSTDHRGRNRF